MAGSTDIAISEHIKEEAGRLGFDLCGIAKARHLSEYESVLNRWCSEGMHDRMNYLARDTEKRANPDKLFPGAKSLIVTGLNYYTETRQQYDDVPLISIYALGRDYHDVIRKKLDDLLLYIKGLIPGTEGKSFCDDAPILEKPWAVEAGLGWRGKHSVVINEKIGSFFFIGILILNTELNYDKPFVADRCGSCTMCIDKCPTKAINNDRTIDARRCIANLTIENRGPIPEEIIPYMGRKIYSCDICQEVCPWNKQAKPHKIPEFVISPDLADMTREEWLSLSEEEFNRIFKGTAVERVKYERFKRNLIAIEGNI